jgi:hypothetical protein
LYGVFVGSHELLADDVEVISLLFDFQTDILHDVVETVDVCFDLNQSNIYLQQHLSFVAFQLIVQLIVNFDLLQRLSLFVTLTSFLIGIHRPSLPILLRVVNGCKDRLRRLPLIGV